MIMLYSAPSLPCRHPYVQVSIGYDILENGNSNWKLKKNANMGNFGRHGDAYAVVGRPNDLVMSCTVVTDGTLCFRTVRLSVRPSLHQSRRHALGMSLHAHCFS